MSAGYMDQSGILVGSEYNKANGRVNASLNVTKRLRVGINLGVSRAIRNGAGGGGKESALHHAIIHSPLVGRDAATRDCSTIRDAVRSKSPGRLFICATAMRMLAAPSLTKPRRGS